MRERTGGFWVPFGLAVALMAAVASSLAQPAPGAGRMGGPPPGERMGGPARGSLPPGRGGAGSAAERDRARRMAGIEPRSYTFEPTGEEMPYFVYVSRRSDEDDPSPLVVLLHGMGVSPDLVLSQVSAEANRHGYIVVAPMGYNVRGGYGAYPLGLGDPPDPRVNEWSEQDVMNVLALARKEFNVDDRRIYLVGQSMGGAGALHLGRKFSDIWAAVGATAPAVGDEEPTGLEDVRHMPFVIVHGDEDPAVPVERSRRWAAKLDELDMNFEYHEIRGGGHSDAILTGAPYVFDFFDANVRPDQRSVSGE